MLYTNQEFVGKLDYIVLMYGDDSLDIYEAQFKQEKNQFRAKFKLSFKTFYVKEGLPYWYNYAHSENNNGLQNLNISISDPTVNLKFTHR